MHGKGRSRGPAHQNEFAFRHNPKSKKTEKILASPNQGLCQRCHDKVEWRKKYRKYKPLTAPATCNMCREKTVRAAYHTVCQPCAKSRNACAWCLGSKAIVDAKQSEESVEEARLALEREIKGLHLRKQRTILREFDRTQGKMDVTEAIKKAEKAGGRKDEDDDDDFEFYGEDEDDEDDWWDGEEEEEKGEGKKKGGQEEEEDGGDDGEEEDDDEEEEEED